MQVPDNLILLSTQTTFCRTIPPAHFHVLSIIFTFPSTVHSSILAIGTPPTLASPTFLNMEDDKNIEMIDVQERNSSKEGSVENGVVKPKTDVSSEKGILDVRSIYETSWPVQNSEHPQLC